VPACWDGIGEGFDRWLEIIWRLGAGALVLDLKPLSILSMLILDFSALGNAITGA
jgi:hypothetical protein